MLHEVLLALSGYPGGIFIENVETGVVKVVDDLPFIHVSETAILNRLSRLVTHYIKFERFIHRFSYAPSVAIKTKDEVVAGLYLRALCHGLDDVLQQYRHILLNIERQLLADSHLTAAFIQTELEEFQLLFPALLSLVEQIEKNKIRGCSILDLLHKSAASSVPLIRTAIFKILRACHVVFYKQLLSWMLHGRLADRHDEFVICRAVMSVQTNVSNNSLDDDLDLGGVTGQQLNRIMQLSETALPNVTSSAGSFSIRATQLPSYIPLRVAEKILFVGESVCMFDSHKQTNDIGSLLNGQEEEFAKEIHELSQQPTFDPNRFEEVIDKIRSCVAEQLWMLVVERAQLTSTLHTLKDFFLLGRGELFLAFIDQASSMLQTPPAATTQHDVNLAFQHAARSVLLEDENLLQHFKFEVHVGKSESIKASSDDKATVKKENGWECLKLAYTADWPLHILFTTSVLERYNTLFVFLLRIKRVQLRLQQCWALQMRRRHLRCVDDTNSGSTWWWLRNHMAFLVDNLQYYLLADVIESHSSILMNKIQSTRDFEAIRLAHDQFLSSLYSQCFMHLKAISHCLGEILELCNTFCGLISHSEDTLSAQEISKIDSIAVNFRRQSGLLFQVLSGVRNQQANPHLAQLLLRIDFNKYFTSYAPGQIAATVPSSFNVR